MITKVTKPLTDCFQNELTPLMQRLDIISQLSNEVKITSKTFSEKDNQAHLIQ